MNGRLTRHSEFVRVQREGVRRQTSHFVLYISREASGAGVRLGITVSRRIGNAVIRNRLKRRLRECFRLELARLMPPDSAMVVIGRGGSGNLDTPSIKVELKAATVTLTRQLQATYQS